MSTPQTHSEPRFQVECIHCERVMLARAGWTDWVVACPYCQSPLTVPELSGPPGQPVRARRSRIVAKQAFNVACPRCQSLLETHTGASGRVGTCPTCAARFQIPYVDRRGLPDAARLIDGDVDAPTPLHAYAASGQQAPRIIRRPDGTAAIACPKCGRENDVDASGCAACGTPFTIEAAPSSSAMQATRDANLSLVFGVASLLLPVFIPAIVAIGLGGRAVFAPTHAERPWRGLVGMGLGLCSLCGSVWLLAKGL